MNTKTVQGILSVALLLSLGPMAHAQYTGPNAKPVVTTAAAAAKAADDTPVVLEGTLERQLTSDTYEFRDASGTVKAEIDEEDFPQKIGATTRVRLHGEVDRDWKSVEIDVKRIEIP
ncbi:NirD/YgiW/YdeI family stress tolerance protein [Lysobacter cavernae]|uniref:NirD/YgiW/YdeI family stress tolerance protein n=1 Tax=Lysobacter cavernae TaxID=1685901 RepID=A0ABV7RVK8_9GAMM